MMATTATTSGVFLRNPLVFAATEVALVRLGETAAATALGELLPDVVRTWLARARLLEGVPFQHLIPDSQLLPPESIRFFHVNREWTDALVQGALSVGTVTTQDRRQLQELHAAIRDEVDAEERRVRMVGGELVGFAPAGPISGFLLRSRLVSGWPAMHVRAYKEEIGADDGPIDENDPRRMRLLRLERLAPAVLLCLFDGIPAIVHLEEPRSGVQYGVDLGPSGQPEVKLRDVTTAQRLERRTPPPPLPHKVPVLMRKDCPGVIAVETLGELMSSVPATQIFLFEGPKTQSAEFGMEMLQFPFRQVFGDTTAGQTLRAELAAADAFVPTVALDEVRSWEEGR
jgi:hypothetical protein